MGLADQWDAPTGQIDDRSDHLRAGQHQRDWQDRAGTRRSNHHHQQGYAVRHTERTEVPGRVGGRVVFLAQHERR